MKTPGLAFAPALLTLVLGTAAFAAAADPRAEAGKSPAQLACERACHELHLGWVDMCVAYHDPREIEPNARGQCVAAGAERLRQCVEACR